AAVEHVDDVGVLEACRRRRLAPEALDELLVLSEAAVQDLDRDIPAQVLVMGAVDVGHAARADPARDPVPAVDQAVLGYLSHRCRHSYLLPFRAAPAIPASRPGRPPCRPRP